MIRSGRIREEQQTSGKKLVNWINCELRRATELVLASDIGIDIDLVMVLQLDVENCCECSVRLASRKD